MSEGEGYAIDAIAHLVDDLKTGGALAQAIERIYGLKRVAGSEGFGLIEGLDL